MAIDKDKVPFDTFDVDHVAPLPSTKIIKKLLDIVIRMIIIIFNDIIRIQHYSNS